MTAEHLHELWELYNNGDTRGCWEAMPGLLDKIERGDYIIESLRSELEAWKSRAEINGKIAFQHSERLAELDSALTTQAKARRRGLGE